MAVFGLTMAVPFVALSLLPARLKAIPRSGEWMNTVKAFMGFVELAAALKFLSNSDLVWGWQLFSREFFLLLWGLIFVAAALYLFGVFASGSRPGTRRRVGAVATALFAVYCFVGMSGRKLDFVMTAIAPPYSGGLLGWNWYVTGGSWTIVKDDYDEALARAAREDKLLLVNFTGFT
jgi:thiol:disulfide interchange protein